MRLCHLLLSLLAAGLLGALGARPVQGRGFLAPTEGVAVPPLPSSFYGSVRVNGEAVPEGTVVRAMIEGQVYAEAQTVMVQGGSVYSLDVPGDDPETPERDGGVEGCLIQFKVGGVMATQTATWHSGTNVELDIFENRVRLPYMARGP